MTAEGKSKRFSFVIPVYNAARHLECCLKSIRTQDYDQDAVEIIIADGGSTDDTLRIAGNFSSRIISNPKKLAEYGVQAGMREAGGRLLVVFAADNELVGKDWLLKVEDIFNSDAGVSAVWGRLASGQKDAPLNKYFELIQSDPLNWFLNRNLEAYRKKTACSQGGYFVFTVKPSVPLVWGANGLVCRAEKIKDIWAQDGYLGDNDAFQYMLEKGDNKVAYFNSAFVYHHHVARLGDWISKWRRNFRQHLLDKQETRNMNWVFTGNFKLRLLFWSAYCAVPVLALLHSFYLAVKNRNPYWFYHPFVSCAQFWTYMSMVIFSRQARDFVIKGTGSKKD